MPWHPPRRASYQGTAPWRWVLVVVRIVRTAPDSRRARSASGAGHRLAHVGEPRIRREHLRLVVDEVVDDDVGVPDRGERAELRRDGVDGAVDGRVRRKAAITCAHPRPGDRLRLHITLADVDVAPDRDRGRPLAVRAAPILVVGDERP